MTNRRPQFRLLGPLEVVADGRDLTPGRPKQRALLALLALRPNEILASDALIDALWGERPPETAKAALRGHVSSLRKLLGRDAIQTRPPGYVLRVSPEQTDLGRFQTLLDEARKEPRASERARLLRSALSLFRGEPLADFRYEDFARQEAERLEELRLSSLEERVDADLELGRHGELSGELRRLVGENPLRERLWGQLMLALYRTGRQAEALQAYQEARRVLTQQLGLDPGPALKELERKILSHDPALSAPGLSEAAVGTRDPRRESDQAGASGRRELAASARERLEHRVASVCLTCGHENRRGASFCEECAAPLPVAAGREQLKTVTVLFSEVSGSTSPGASVDPEAHRALMGRYFERTQGIVERYGGTLENFIGDAVMAVFGVPVVHEDDALRAVRAATELRAALPELEIEAQIGLNTGEVVTGTEDRLAIGDAVNVAARLGQAAGTNEVLIGEPTLVLVRQTADVERLEPLAVKGKAEPLPVYRLLAVGEAPERGHETLFVGRRRELAVLLEAWERARSEHRCELVTVTGEAGVGKSRLAKEFVARVEATVVEGRCLPYGQGITYWPVVEVLKQLNVLAPDEAAAESLRSLLGETEAVTSTDEIAWAFRKTLEHAATKRPLVVVFDDIQWGEQTFLDLIEHVALLSSGAAILLLCLARPELAEDRSGWPITIRLEHLGEAEVERLIPNRIGAGLRRRIARAAGGNPLFIEEMLAMAEQSDAQVTVPPTLQALLAARLDRLEAPERSTLERAAVEGEVFHRGAVQALGAGDQVIRYLAALVRKELIIPAATQIPDEEAFRFRHLLIRDAAYNALPKAVRADLHERFAGWLDERGARVVEMDEIVGYHLERACRYRSELGISVDEGVVTAARRRLTDAGERALVRQDEGTAVSLLERAASLVPEGQLDLGLEVELAVALSATGRNPEALGRARSIAERAVAAGDRIGELCGRLLEGSSRTFIEPEGATEQLEALLDDALPVLEGSGDDLALFVGNYALGRIAIMRLQFDAGIEVYDRAAEHARRARLPHHFLGQRALLRLKGTTPLPDVLAWLEEQGSQGSQPLVLKSYRADALARLGREAEARAMVSDLLSELADRGAEAGERVMAMGFQCLDVELLVGDADAAVRLGEEACAALEAEDERSVLSTVAGKLAQALYELGRLEEADAWAGRAAELGASDDAMTQFLWRQARAKVLARWGQHAEAQRLGHEAIAIAEDTEALEFQADAYADLAEVLSLAGRLPQAVEALGEALERYERKGDIVMAQRTRERLAPIGDGEGADRSI